MLILFVAYVEIIRFDRAFQSLEIMNNNIVRDGKSKGKLYPLLHKSIYLNESKYCIH